MNMHDQKTLDHNIEELLAVCSRSIVSPDMIVMEANRIMANMNDCNLEPKFIVEGCESLSILASSFIQNEFDSLIVNYAHKSGINHWISGFANKNELIKFCEFCVEYGEETLSKTRNTMMMQLEIENGMTKDEICDLNRVKFELKKKILLGSDDVETRKLFCETYQNLITVQDQITNYIILSLLVNSLKEFFKSHYKGLN
ncbi:hypothetical protein [Sinanaerobacter chloroacetimidivorans]|uniref:Uncharacterized protein n=1 Tax=Sinanaerobacter chloroacetimidivorans TaxID=2818044 RepID=A0A8J8B2S8_9FIRM|nr:hypothetical protein [Sinanaerobacter chloroacetimidivorans]MBR0599634.1 hypothetical protein [Sinanaerobacter chloroacetimidivorans]